MRLIVFLVGVLIFLIQTTPATALWWLVGPAAWAGIEWLLEDEDKSAVSATQCSVAKKRMGNLIDDLINRDKNSTLTIENERLALENAGTLSLALERAADQCSEYENFSKYKETVASFVNRNCILISGLARKNYNDLTGFFGDDEEGLAELKVKLKKVEGPFTNLCSDNQQKSLFLLLGKIEREL